MKLIFIRHGETNFNKLGIIQGQEEDTPLNETGIKQVKDAANELPRDEIEAIFSSPLKRALETAEIINLFLNKEIKLDGRLKEFSYGSLAGKTWEEIEVITGDPEIRHKDKKLQFNYRAYGGESIEDVKTRLNGFLEEIKVGYASETLLIATHGGIIDTMRLLVMQNVEMQALNASLHQFEF